MKNETPNKTDRFAMVPMSALSLMQSLHAADIRVYLCIAMHADGAGDCYPSMGRIAELAGIDRRNICRAVASLERSGLLTRDRGGLGRSTTYHLRCPSPAAPLATVQPPAPVAKAPKAPATPKAAPSLLPDPPAAPSAKVDTDMVSRIYECYPRKVGKKPAMAKIEAAIKTISRERKLSPAEAAAWLVARTQAYAVSRVGQDPQFTPFPSTWFFQARYDDVATTEPTTPLVRKIDQTRCDVQSISIF